MLSNKRIFFLNTFAIILVCIGHSFTAVESIYWHKWIYCFHMPLFMFISGYLLSYTVNEKGSRICDITFWGKQEYIVKKVKRLLIPYFFISTLSFYPKVLLSEHALRPVDNSIQSYIHMLIYPWDNVIKFFWFLPTLFIISIFSVVLYKLVNKYKIQLPIYTGLLLLVLLYEFNPAKDIQLFNLGGTVSYLIFFITGTLFASHEVQVVSKLKLSNPLTAAILIVLYSLLIKYIDWGTAFIGLVYAFIGISFAYSLSCIYVKLNFRFLNHLNNCSYAIYLFSWYPLVLVQSFLMKHIDIPWQIWAIIATLLQIYIPYYIYKVIIYCKKNIRYGKTFALLLGQ